jgi:hypothetical protein
MCIARATQDPELVQDILNKIASVTDEARQLLADPELPRPMILSALSVSITPRSWISAHGHCSSRPGLGAY